MRSNPLDKEGEMRVKVYKMCSEFVFVCVNHKHTAQQYKVVGFNDLNNASMQRIGHHERPSEIEERRETTNV